jgi:di/tricarboxylate transporter
MEGNVQVSNPLTKPKSSTYWLKSLIGVAILVVFWVLPPFAAMTPVGMSALGIFCMLIYFCAINEIMWPCILAVMAESFMIPQLYPDYVGNSLYRSIELSWGFWLIPFIIGSFVICYALIEIGTMRRIAINVLSTKLARKNPWTFTITIWLASLLIGMFFDPSSVFVFFVSFGQEMFQRLGYKKGDKYPAMVVTGVAFCQMLAFGMTPICHALPILALGVYAGITGDPINMVSYMALGVPMGLVCFVGLCVIFRIFFKPDLSNFDNANLETVVGEKPGPMEPREKAVITVAVFVLVWWLLAGVLGAFAPGGTFTAFLSNCTNVMPPLAGVCLLGAIHLKGRPLLNIAVGMKNGVPWGTVLLLAAFMMIGNGIAQQSTGFGATVASLLGPFLHSGYSAFTIMFVVCGIAIVLTNFLNNIPINLLLINLCVPLAMAGTIGLAPLAVAIMVTYACQMAFAAPSAFVVIAQLYGEEWAIPKQIMKHGIIMMFWCVIATGIVGYLFSMLFYG